MFSNQHSQAQAVSTSKHGRVCAQGCCRRPSTPGKGTSGQGPGEAPLGKQEPFRMATGHHGRCQSPRGWGHGGCLLPGPPGSSSPPAPPPGHGSDQRKQGVPPKRVPRPQLSPREIGRGLKVFGDRMTEVHGSLACITSRKPRSAVTQQKRF